MADGSTTRYAVVPGGAHVAYQTAGEAPIDLVAILGWYSHVEAVWEEPIVAHFLRRLTSFARVILFDKRGVGLSDPVPLASLPSMEEWAEDVVAVMDAAGSTRAVVLAAQNGGPLAMVFAAMHPERTAGLVLLNSFARLARADDYPAGIPQRVLDARRAERDTAWGRPVRDAGVFNPSLAGNTRFAEWMARYERQCAGPGAARAMRELMFSVDVRSVLPVISAPTLVLHRTDTDEIRVGHGRYLADHIPGAKLVELPGSDSYVYAGDVEALLGEVEEFVTGARAAQVPDRFLATVMFTDIVGSTGQAVELGDRRWRDILDAHDALVNRHLEQYRGTRVKGTGDGVLATFDGPARALQCGASIRDALDRLGMPVRVGVHTGEVERRADDVTGIAVHTARRVEAAAAAGEVWASRTVVDLVAGSGLSFEDRGDHDLKGVPGPWRLYAFRR